jgi:PKD repeat protein
MSKKILAILTVAVFGLLTTSASANVFTQSIAAPQVAANASIQAADTLDLGSLFYDASGTNYQDNSVTIAPGQTVDFSFPDNGQNNSSHNVVFGVPGVSGGAQPTSCVQTAAPNGFPILPAPPLPIGTEGPGWAGNCTFNTPGTYAFYCSAHQYMTGTVVVQDAPANTPPTVTASRNPSGDVTTGTSIAFTATGADADGDTVTYAWDFGDGGTSTQASDTHTYATPGDFAAKVTVSDGKGGSNSQTLNVHVTQANRNPTVTASRTPTGDVTSGTAVAFSATGADADGDTLTYSWDFGDASAASTDQNPSHTYATAGSYVAKVTVSDGKGGTGSATVAVNVTAGSGSCTAGAYRDDFNGTSLASSWSVIRPSGTMSVGNGVVTLPGESGDIYEGTNTATNLVVRTMPSGAVTITAKINFKGAERYQQTGIIVYGDDDNYTKLDRVATNAAGGTVTEKFEFVNESGATARNTNQDYTSNLPQATFPNDYYLRITSDGTNLTGSYSTDGTTWTNVGRSAAAPANPKAGIYALSNGATTVVNGTVDWFEMTGPNVVPDGCGQPTNSSPVISSATATPTQGIAPLPVNFTAAATDADSDTLSYSWNFGDNTTPSTQQNPSHTYAAAGTFNAVVTVSDGKGGTATKTVPVTVAPPDNASARYRVLVFSKTAAFRHDSIPNGIAAIQQLGQQKNFQVDATEDGGWFRDDILSHYKAVIWLETTGDVLTDTQQAAFERYIEAGGGYVGIHSAADTEYAWPWYGKLVGAYFKDHPNGTPAGAVLREDKTDPSTVTLPDRWSRTDEWYNFQTFENPVSGGGAAAVAFNPRNNPDLHILLTTDTSSYSGAVPAGTDHPIAWCHKYDGGRSWYTALGHTQASYTEAPFLDHIYGGIQVAAGAVPSVCGVAPANNAPTVTTSRTPTGTVAPGTAVAFTATGADADSDTLTYSWDFGDGSAASTQQNPTHTYATAGTYNAKVTVSDGKGGTATSTEVVTVQEPGSTNNAPTISSATAAPSTGAAPLAVAFTVAATDADSDPLTYAWDFGDGSAASTQQNPTHTYATAGAYTAKVTVSDGKGGAATRSLPITVSIGSVTTTGEVGADVPTLLALSLGGPATIGPITPGVSRDYTATVPATVTSTAGDAALSVVDPDAAQPGKLVNGTYVLASPLQVMATNAANPTGAFAPVGGAANPLTVLSWPRAISSDQVTITFKQAVADTETLRAGTYSKTLTFTLATSNP